MFLSVDDVPGPVLRTLCYLILSPEHPQEASTTMISISQMRKLTRLYFTETNGVAAPLGASWSPSPEESFVATVYTTFPQISHLSLTSCWETIMICSSPSRFGASLKGCFGSKIPQGIRRAFVVITVLFNSSLCPILFPFPAWVLIKSTGQ